MVGGGWIDFCFWMGSLPRVTTRIAKPSLAILTGRLDPSGWLIDFLEKKMLAEESYQDFKAQLRKEVLNGPPTERGVGEPH